MAISPYSFPGIKSELLPENLFLGQKRLNYKIAQKTILKIVAEQCGVTVESILSESRKREVVDARHIYYGAIRIKFRVTLTAMGEDTGKRDHTTVRHGLKKFYERYVTEDTYREITDKVLEKLSVNYSGERLHKGK